MTSRQNSVNTPRDTPDWSPEADVQILVPALPSAMTSVRVTGRLFCEKLELDSKTTHLIILAVDEACTNIIRHCYAGKDGKIMISYRRKGDGLEVKIRDWGPPCPMECLKLKEDADLKPGGFGLLFMHSIMDDISLIRHEDEGNELVMLKKLGGK